MVLRGAGSRAPPASPPRPFLRRCFPMGVSAPGTADFSPAGRNFSGRTDETGDGSPAPHPPHTAGSLDRPHRIQGVRGRSLVCSSGRLGHHPAPSQPAVGAALPKAGGPASFRVAPDLVQDLPESPLGRTPHWGWDHGASACRALPQPALPIPAGQDVPSIPEPSHQYAIGADEPASEGPRIRGRRWGRPRRRRVSGRNVAAQAAVGRVDPFECLFGVAFEQGAGVETIRMPDLDQVEIGFAHLIEGCPFVQAENSITVAQFQCPISASGGKTAKGPGCRPRFRRPAVRWTHFPGEWRGSAGYNRPPGRRRNCNRRRPDARPPRSPPASAPRSPGTSG